MPTSLARRVEMFVLVPIRYESGFSFFMEWDFSPTSRRQIGSRISFIVVRALVARNHLELPHRNSCFKFSHPKQRKI